MEQGGLVVGRHGSFGSSLAGGYPPIARA
jgi:hypothetical protein